MKRARDSRGGAVASKTSREQFGGMREWFAKAAADIEAALEIEPAIVNAHEACISMAKALADADRAVELSPTDVSALLVRATVHMNLGDAARAEEDVRTAERASPGSPEIAEWKSWAVGAFRRSIP